MERANIVIVGGGVVGCAVAMVLARQYDDVFLLEKMPKLGMGASTRNSGVIHSGLYYAKGSLKARHCVAGNHMIYEFCAAHNVPHRRTGKIIVATSAEEQSELEELFERGRENGVEGLRIIGQATIRSREPHIAGRAAIEVPSTGIVASEELVKAYARVASDRGAHIVVNAKVERLEPSPTSVRVSSTAGQIETRCLINCAGLFADAIAALIGNVNYRIYPVRGEYCEVIRQRSHLIRGLVYPLPHPEGLSLGVHFTRTLWDTVLVGPTARYQEDKNDYERDREPVEEFARRARLLVPGIRVEDLIPSYSGIRAKLVPPDGKGPADFVIERDPGWPTVIHLVGIESPGLTSALSIAHEVSKIAADTMN